MWAKAKGLLGLGGGEDGGADAQERLQMTLCELHSLIYQQVWHGGWWRAAGEGAHCALHAGYLERYAVHVTCSTSVPWSLLRTESCKWIPAVAHRQQEELS